MSEQINLTKTELTEYLTEIDKGEHFAEWLYKKRATSHTLDSLLAAPATKSKATGAGKVAGESRPPIDYESTIYPIVETAAKEGIHVKDIIAKAGAAFDYKLDKARISTALKGDAAKVHGIKHEGKNVFTFKATATATAKGGKK